MRQDGTGGGEESGTDTEKKGRRRRSVCREQHTLEGWAKHGVQNVRGTPAENSQHNTRVNA